MTTVIVRHVQIENLEVGQCNENCQFHFHKNEDGWTSWCPTVLQCLDCGYVPTLDAEYQRHYLCPLCTEEKECQCQQAWQNNATSMPETCTECGLWRLAYDGDFQESDDPSEDTESPDCAECGTEKPEHLFEEGWERWYGAYDEDHDLCPACARMIA